MPKRETRSRLQWFAFDVDAFLDDPRMSPFTIKERSAWAMILIKSFRTQGQVCTNPAIIMEQTALTRKESLELLGKLFDSKLLQPGNDIYSAHSPRMKKESAIAQQATEQRREAGKQRAATANRDESGRVISPAVAGAAVPPADQQIKKKNKN